MIKVEIERTGPTHRWSEYVRFTLADWCWTNVGSGQVFNDIPADDDLLTVNGFDWYAQIWYGYAEFYFHDPKQATMFKLRWS